MGKPSLIVRVDAAFAMGIGHVMRCAALGQAWQDDGGVVIFAMSHSTQAVDEYLRGQAFTKISLPPKISCEEEIVLIAGIAHDTEHSCIVVDGYQFDFNYQRLIKLAGMKLLLMDDIGQCQHYSADLVLNQNLTARENMYANREPWTRLLLGTNYVLLRREFRRWQARQRNVALDARNVLITIGGTDPDNLTLRLMQAMAAFAPDSLGVTVIVGGSNPRLRELQDAAAILSPAIRILTDVYDMPALMANAEVAIICGGGTLWETLYMGCATLTYSRPGVQEEIHAKLAAAGAVIHLGLLQDFNGSSLAEAASSLLSSPDRRAGMGTKGKTIIDGKGTDRTLNAIKDLIH